MEVISYKNIEYICVDYIYNNAPIYSKTCRNGRDLIKKKDIKDFIYLRLKDNVWVVSDGKSMKYDKIFIKKDFINSIPELNNLDKITDDAHMGCGIEAAPSILELKDYEKFKDIDGKPLNIEVRGDRKSDKCFFKVKDVSDAFEMPNLYTTIISSSSKYLINEHYKYFYLNKLHNMQNKQLKNKELFLTYEGVLRVIFNSENNKTKGFVKWATETLFTVQMGDKEDKDNLASTLLGTTYKVVKQVFRSSARTTPCVYLLILKEENNKLICKYGFTKDLVRRMKEHKTFFGKEFSKEPTLLYYSIIDSIYISEAETDINCYFSNDKYKYNYGSMEELVIIDKSELKQIKMIYQCIENKYIGRYEELKNEITELKIEILELNNKLKTIDIEHKHEIELLKEKHNNDLHKKDIELYKKENDLLAIKDKYLIELQKKDIDILKKELELSKKYNK
jgi:hypothetical protein